MVSLLGFTPYARRASTLASQTGWPPGGSGARILFLRRYLPTDRGELKGTAKGESK